MKDLKDPQVLIPTKFPFNSPIWPVQKIDGFWRTIKDYSKFIQVVTPIAAAVQDMISLLEQAIHFLVPGMQLFTWQMLPFSMTANREHNK